MGKHEKLIFKIFRGVSDANIRFEELREILLALGFEERTKGSHCVYRKKGIADKINIQKDGSKAKPYQVRQVRSVLVRYKLVGEE